MEKWLEDYYKETDPIKRQRILLENAGRVSESDPLSITKEEKTEIQNNDKSEELIMRLWTLRYGKGMPRKDNFVREIMNLKFLAESDSADITGSRRKQAFEVLNNLGLIDADKREEIEKNIILMELKNAFLRYIEVSQKGRGFTSVLFGMGQISEEGTAKKLADQISSVAFRVPHMLRMEREFELFKNAALMAFREVYPNREHLLTKL